MPNYRSHSSVIVEFDGKTYQLCDSKTKPNTLVKFRRDPFWQQKKEDKNLNFDQFIAAYKYPQEFKHDLLFLGDIENMPHHCTVVGKSGKVYFGYHTDNFIVIPVDET